MYEIVEGSHVITDDRGYSGIHAKRYAEANGLILVVVTPPETWEMDEADEQAW